MPCERRCYGLHGCTEPSLPTGTGAVLLAAITRAARWARSAFKPLAGSCASSCTPAAMLAVHANVHVRLSCHISIMFDITAYCLRCGRCGRRTRRSRCTQAWTWSATRSSASCASLKSGCDPQIPVVVKLPVLPLLALLSRPTCCVLDALLLLLSGCIYGSATMHPVQPGLRCQSGSALTRLTICAGRQ